MCGSWGQLHGADLLEQWQLQLSASQKKKNLLYHCHLENSSSLDTVRRIAQSVRCTGYGLDEPGIYSRRSNDQKRPGRFCSTPSFSYTGYRWFLSTGVRFQFKNERSSTCITPIWFQDVDEDNCSFCLLHESKLCQHARYPNSKLVRSNYALTAACRAVRLALCQQNTNNGLKALQTVCW